jgi:hypothetical protein
VFHHPLYARDGHFCKMCFSCLRGCPHGSANLFIRAPLQSLWNLNDLSSTLTPLALAGFFVAIVLFGSRNISWMASPFGFTVSAVLAITFAIVLYMTLPKFLSGEHNPDPAMASRVALALFLLGWGPLMAFHLQKVPGLAVLQFRIVEESFWASYMPFTGVTVLSILQLGVISLAAIFTMISLWQIRKKCSRQEVKYKQWGWWMLGGLCTVYLLAVLGIFIR